MSVTIKGATVWRLGHKGKGKQHLIRLAGGGDPTPPYPAPDGYTWFYETYNGLMVTYAGQPNLYLQRTS